MILLMTVAGKLLEMLPNLPEVSSLSSVVYPQENRHLGFGWRDPLTKLDCRLNPDF